MPSLVTAQLGEWSQTKALHVDSRIFFEQCGARRIASIASVTMASVSTASITMASIPTAGVRVDPDTAQFEMIYNPDFFASLPEDQVRGVLKHEFYHLIFEHVTSRKPEGVPHKRQASREHHF